VEYLKIKRAQKQLRADGSRYAIPLFVTKTKKYGKVTSEQTISRTQPIIVTGAHDSGKTRWLTRLHEHTAEIWGAKIKAAPLFLDTLSPLGAWCDKYMSKSYVAFLTRIRSQESVAAPRFEASTTIF